MRKPIILILLLVLLSPGCTRRKRKYVSPDAEGLKTGIWDQSNWNQAKWG